MKFGALTNHTYPAMWLPAGALMFVDVVASTWLLKATKCIIDQYQRIKRMTELNTIETIPLEVDPNGVIRVSKTRVTLDTIVQAFNDGATAEEIAQQYPSVPLADI